ncbi:MAG: MBL fold metallo-hydrolase [Hyphomicrobiales bacterium]
MKLTRDVYVVGGGRFGFGISGPLDCHVYVLDSGNGELALVDPGLGLAGDFDLVLQNMRDDGLDPSRVRKLILTHYHCDHVGAAAEACARLDAEVIASYIAAPVIRSGDEHAVALDVAKAAGFYPPDYHLPPCPVHREVREGDEVESATGARRLGNPRPLRRPPELPHSRRRPHLPARRRSRLLGRPHLLQNIHDCRIDAYASSVAKAAALDFDALLPGHLQISLRGGKQHVDQAAAAFRQLGVPPNLM